MNYLVAALFSKSVIGMTGSYLLMIFHGLVSSSLFFLVGTLYERYKSRNIFYYRSLVTIMPIFTFFFFYFTLANLGFPTTANYIPGDNDYYCTISG
jgi:NADH-quinone oxidoreductase subunit M